MKIVLAVVVLVMAVVASLFVVKSLHHSVPQIEASGEELQTG